ncbi:MBL fold metallo-hydrolase [Halomonas sp. McH1-25]|uniref:MBL fold metallo-hydrolase n=1 Tax=unclassified Halomonas TaxID=2609666 RepID=UPI001EF5CD5A|nr:MULTISPECIES: MBL fold metallo-hydrolase [unclassified Halomonas]MCG7600869.1 MBL fold metallo-hydrolase [Halomonas sp. McH1-25]MCP1341457.1 MBL fold metallo-hydrolase [Halomonas sp. FL8]MCP1360048.1 MBL fold metallo-hydrolase [Halomonas sp. BBD45]MCP1364660.1 MBL fold metallo-hydrolase [Halomonas sp. BBD48]
MRIFRHSPGVPDVAGFYDPRTSSVQYIVSDPATRRCAILDPVLDFDEKSGATATHQADGLLDYVAQEGLIVDWILETHPHADHFSAAQYLKEKTGAPTAIGAYVTQVQALWKEIYNWPDFPADGHQWDYLLAEGDPLRIGEVEGRVMFSPGHTPASVTYVIGDAAFVHDTLFQPDGGTARADFPGGDAHKLWDSIQAILSLPDDTRLFTGHDYIPGGREPEWESTVRQQRETNIHLCNGQTAEGYVSMRNARDAGLPMPKLLLQSLQINIRGGALPEPEDNGRRYLKIPLDALPGAAWDEARS